MMRRFLALAKAALIGLLAFNLSACNSVEDLLNEAREEVEKMLIEQVHNLIHRGIELVSEQLDKVQNESAERFNQEQPAEPQPPYTQPEIAPSDVLMPGPGQYEA